jgi:hypothetical protein
VRESRAALQNDETLDRRTKRRENKADDWAKWLRSKMDDTGCANPTEILPDAFARLEQLSEDHAAAAVRKIKKALKDALK